MLDGINYLFYCKCNLFIYWVSRYSFRRDCQRKFPTSKVPLQLFINIGRLGLH